MRLCYSAQKCVGVLPSQQPAHPQTVNSEQAVRLLDLQILVLLFVICVAGVGGAKLHKAALDNLDTFFGGPPKRGKGLSGQSASGGWSLINLKYSPSKRPCTFLPAFGRGLKGGGYHR